MLKVTGLWTKDTADRLKKIHIECNIFNQIDNKPSYVAVSMLTAVESGKIVAADSEEKETGEFSNGEGVYYKRKNLNQGNWNKGSGSEIATGEHENILYLSQSSILRAVPQRIIRIQDADIREDEHVNKEQSFFRCLEDGIEVEIEQRGIGNEE